jgi:hypothetical protein
VAERQLPKLNVAGSIPVSRSIIAPAPSLVHVFSNTLVRFCPAACGCGADDWRKADRPDRVQLISESNVPDKRLGEQGEGGTASIPPFQRYSADSFVG